MINRLDSICQAVLKGKWPGVRRAYEGNAVTSFYTTKLLDNTTTLTEDPSASPQGSKVKKHVADREKEFSVKINDVCYFTFSPTNADLQCHCSAWHVLFVFIVWSSLFSSSICLFLSSFHLIFLWKFCSFSLIFSLHSQHFCFLYLSGDQRYIPVTLAGIKSNLLHWSCNIRTFKLNPMHKISLSLCLLL